MSWNYDGAHKSVVIGIWSVTKWLLVRAQLQSKVLCVVSVDNTVTGNLHFLCPPKCNGYWLMQQVTYWVNM